MNTTESVTAHSLAVDVNGDGDSTFNFTFRLDGTGTCEDQNCGGEKIEFTWDPAMIAGLDEAERNDTLHDYADGIFWDEINDQLDEDRVLREGDFGDEEVSFECGSSEDLERYIQLVLYSFGSIWDEEREEIRLTINAATENEAADIDEYCDLMEDGEIPDKQKEAIRELIGIGLRWNLPYGFHLEYNDGAAGRASGYYESANTLYYEVPKPSFHELAEGRGRLTALLAEWGYAEEAREMLALPDC